MTRPSAEAASTPGTVGRVAGVFVSFEGIDRSGKTTQARMLVDALGPEAVPVREPGGTPLGERVRDAYERLVEAEPSRFRRVDGSRPPDAVHADVLALVGAARGAAV